MALLASIASFIAVRSVFVIASVVLHASVATGLVVVLALGHSNGAPIGRAAAAMEIDLDLTNDAPPVKIDPPAREDRDEAPTLSNHTHPYPVEPSHETRAHDPSLAHDHATTAPPDHDHDRAAAPDHTGEAAAAAPAIVADVGVMPRFTMSSGGRDPRSPAGVHVATNGSGSGSGTGASTGGGGLDDVTHAAASVQVAARLVRSAVAAYPVHARADELEGDVAVELIVDHEGRVVEARVIRPAVHGFDEAALAAVRAYHFSPAQREGHAVRVRMPWSVQFRLR